MITPQNLIIQFKNGKPVAGNWKKGKVVQRMHGIVQLESGLYLLLNEAGPDCPSDADSKNAKCVQDYEIHLYTDVVVTSDVVLTQLHDFLVL